MGNRQSNEQGSSVDPIYYDYFDQIRKMNQKLDTVLTNQSSLMGCTHTIHLKVNKLEKDTTYMEKEIKQFKFNLDLFKKAMTFDEICNVLIQTVNLCFGEEGREIVMFLQEIKEKHTAPDDMFNSIIQFANRFVGEEAREFVMFLQVIQSNFKASQKKPSDRFTFNLNNPIGKRLNLALHNYALEEYNEMTVNLDDAEIYSSCDTRILFASHLQPKFKEVANFKKIISTTSVQDLDIMHETTYRHLESLAKNHEEVTALMKEPDNKTFIGLIKFLFEQKDIGPFSDKWDCMMRMSSDLIKYFESLSKPGKCISKSYILLFIEILLEFVLLQKRLLPEVNIESLPFIFTCISFCESELTNYDAWNSCRYEVYRIAVLRTVSSLQTGSLQWAPWFSNHLRCLEELEKHPATLGTNRRFGQELITQRKIGTDLLNGSMPRIPLCSSAALYYYYNRQYNGMCAILEAADDINSLKVQVGFACKLSTDFITCVKSIETIVKEKSLVEVLTKAQALLRLALNDHSKIIQHMGLHYKDHLCNWVNCVLKIINNEERNTFTSTNWNKAIIHSFAASEYIDSLGEPGKCISQSYLWFFMSFLTNVAIKYSFHREDTITQLQIILLVMKLCRSFRAKFSFALKKKVGTLAAYLFVQLQDVSDPIVQVERNELLKEMREYKKMERKLKDVQNPTDCIPKKNIAETKVIENEDQTTTSDIDKTEKECKVENDRKNRELKTLIEGDNNYIVIGDTVCLNYNSNIFVDSDIGNVESSVTKVIAQGSTTINTQTSIKSKSKVQLESFTRKTKKKIVRSLSESDISSYNE